MTEPSSAGHGEVPVNVPADAAFPVPRRCPFDEPEEYGRLREARPISKVSLRGLQQTWWVSRYDEAREVLTDPRFLSDRRRGDFPLVAASPTLQERFRSQPPSMNGMDGAEHIATRRAFIGEFTVRRLDALQPRLQQIVDGCIERLLAAEDRCADLVEQVAVPVPSLAICELLGVPYEDHGFFQDRIARMFRRDSGAADQQRCTDELRAYIDGLVGAEEADPGDNLIGRHVTRRGVRAALDHDALVSTVLLLMTAGHETTASMISLGVLALLSHPAQLAAIKADPGRTPQAVEELLRYFSVAETAILRVAAEDAVVGGVTVKADEGVLVSGLSANRDPAAFTDPQRLDIARQARPHLAFGHGPHQCLGQHLARQELRTVFDTLFRRAPGLRLAVPVEEIDFKAGDSIYGARRLPVTW